MVTFCLKNLLIIFIIFSYYTAKSQDSTVIFYDVIKDDSIVMYFNNSYNFSEKSCSENRRYTKVDGNGDFFQSFTDLNKNGAMMGRGYYEQGVKNGYFETFYSNGQLQSRGKYKDDMPGGSWEYFYENGRPERTLMINVADTLLLQFYDSSGNQTVTDGKGYFNGEVATNDRFLRTKIIASGEVINGKPSGEWKSYLGNRPYCSEKFLNGAFVSGQYSSLKDGTIKYTDRSYLKNIFLPSYIQSLEEFRVFKCFTFKIDSGSVKSKQKGNFEIELEHFRSFVNDAISRVIDSDIRNGNYRDYQPDENLFKLSFKVNDKGVPIDFRQLTSWGDQYFYPVTNAMTMHAKLPTSTKRVYFQLTIVKGVGSTISYRYNFSYD